MNALQGMIGGLRRFTATAVKAPVAALKGSYRSLRSVDGVDETAFALSQILPGIAGPLSGAAVFGFGAPLVLAGALGV